MCDSCSDEVLVLNFSLLRLWIVCTIEFNHSSSMDCGDGGDGATIHGAAERTMVP